MRDGGVRVMQLDALGGGARIARRNNGGGGGGGGWLLLTSYGGLSVSLYLSFCWMGHGDGDGGKVMVALIGNMAGLANGGGERRLLKCVFVRIE